MNGSTKTNDVVGRAALPLVLAVLLSGAALGACAGGDTGTEGAATTAEEMSPEELGELGGRIHAQPERAEEILEEAGLTAAELETRVREITADPAAAERYARGFRDASGATSEPAGG